MEKCPRLDWSQEAQQMFHYHELINSPYVLPWPYQSSTPASSSASATASKSHSEAEKRRRERINGHLSTLRRLIPRSEKMDKAALLGSVVNQVKELKRRANEVGNLFTIPTDVDEVSVDCEGTCNDIHSKNKDCILLKASVCCEDRPELFSDLIQALKGLRLRTVRADIATLGGRIINVLVLCADDSEGIVCSSSLKQSIKAVLSRVASLSMSSVCDFSSKRQRMLLPTNYSDLSV